MGKETSYYCCAECRNCCIYSFTLGHRFNDSPRKPKSCILGEQSRWKKQWGMDETKMNPRYYCEQCSYLCMVAPAYPFGSFAEECPIYSRHYKTQIQKWERCINTDAEFWDFMTDYLEKIKEKYRRGDPRPKWVLHRE